jgi:hypothetical protein
MNFNNIKKIWLRETREMMNSDKFRIAYLIILLIDITFSFISAYFFTVIIIFISFCMINYFIQDKIDNTLILGEFKPLIVSPIGFKEIFAGKYLSILIITLFYALLSIIGSCLTFFLHDMLNPKLVIILFFSLILLFLYLTITSLFSLKYKNIILKRILLTIPWILIFFSGLLMDNHLDEFYILSLISFIISNIVIIETVIILIMLIILIYLLNTLNKENIIKIK